MSIRNSLILITFISSLFSCSQVDPDKRKSFNSDWKFCNCNDSLAFSTDFDDSSWRFVSLPHDWSIEGNFSDKHPTKPAGGALPAGIGWYRKSFQVNETNKDKKIFIDFDGVYRNSEVWINGHYLGKRANGYISFRYDLTPYLKYGKETNLLAVKVDNSIQPNSRWYTGSGIYRNVWLVTVSDIHMNQYGQKIITPVIAAEEATVKVETSINLPQKNTQDISIKSSIYDVEGRKVAEESHYINSNETYFVQNLSIKSPELWSPENPILYELHTELFRNNQKVDKEITKLGLRYFHFDADSGFYFNGKRYEIRGVNLHHDLGALGSAIYDRAIERQLELMKGMGVNAIRTAHNPPAPELLDLCDKMGFLVMDEAFDVWKKRKAKYDYHVDFEDNYKQDLRDLILRDRNHPSVIMWSIGNEIREQFDSTGISITKELAEIVKQIDSTRPVTCALTETDPNKNFIYQSGALDVLGFNYKHEDWANFKKNYPGQKMIASENMSAYATRGHYDMPSDSIRFWPEKFGDPIIGANDDYTVSAYDMVCAFWGATHETTLKAFYKYPFISGIFIWSGIDFIGEPVPYEWPAKSSYYGVVDLAGFPKDVYYLYQSIWTDKPTLHLFPHWNWKNNQEIDVWAYYNQADEVELFLNDTSLGIKSKLLDDMHVMWRVKYKPGTLKAISRKNGKVILEKKIKTAGEPAKIELFADRNEINANGKDLSFITAKIMDENGTLVPNASNHVQFNIFGSGNIAAVDNGYQASHESFKADHRKAFKGMCLAIIQSNGKSGNIVLEATSDNLEPASITLMAR